MSSDFGEIKYRKAAKDHRCEWCGEAIEKGSSHLQFAGVWEGEFQNWRMHHDCYEYAPKDALVEGFTPYENERPIAEPRG